MKSLIKYLFVLIIPVLAGACNKNGTWKLAPGIFILDKASPVESYAELKARLPRTAFYVDRWATWCDPCLDEFSYYDELRPFLDEHHIEILFLNSDMGIEEPRYFEFIEEHDLKGYHVRLNPRLQRDLIDQAMFIPLIPQFMIIDSTGKVLESSARRPSEGKELQSQLIERLGLD